MVMRPLRDLAILRGGDHDHKIHIPLLAKDARAFELIWNQLTPEAVKAFFRDEIKGKVERYALPNIHGIIYILHESLGGGITRQWLLDRRFVFPERLMDYEINVSDDLL